MKTKEYEIGSITELNVGQMKNIKVNDNEILLVRTKDKYYALAPHCTHYGAPLEDGVLSGETIVCPWHHACFNVKNGKVLEPPALDALPQFEVTVDADKLKIILPEKLDERKLPEMSSKSDSDSRKFVILGAGVAGYSAAQTLRENGYSGELIMLTPEEDPPYDRPNLSKDYLQGNAEEEWMPLRPESFYSEHDIDLRLESKVKSVSVDDKILTLGNGDELNYDKLLITTGGIPNELNVPGNDLKNVFYLRSFDDSREIISAAENAEKAVVVGSSFIGMEAAFSLTKRGLKVSVVSKDELPFKDKFGEEIGKLFKNTHTENGVKFYASSGVKEFKGEGKVEKVILDNGDEIETDLVLIGIGVKPATDFIEGLEKKDDESILVDKKFSTGKDVFAAGDIATFPDWRTENLTRIEHFRTAEQQGKTAALAMLDKNIEYNSVPFFWTNQFDLKYRYVGQAKDWDEIYFDGEVESKKFLAYFIKANKILAAAGVNRDKELAAIQALMREARMPSGEQIKEDQNVLGYL